MGVTGSNRSVRRWDGSTFDAVADGEQGQGEQNWAEDAGGCGDPDPGRGKRLVCAAEGERFESDLQRGSGTC
jgi:hypothetical protein